MEKEYLLISKKNLVMEITIQEDAKEDFKKLMGWSEKQFKKNTCERYKLPPKKHSRLTPQISRLIRQLFIQLFIPATIGGCILLSVNAPILPPSQININSLTNIFITGFLAVLFSNILSQALFSRA